MCGWERRKMNMCEEERREKRRETNMCEDERRDKKREKDRDRRGVNRKETIREKKRGPMKGHESVGNLVA